MLDRVVTNPWFGIVGLTIGVVALVLAILFYLWSTRPKVPMVSALSWVIFAKNLKVRGLEINIDGKPVDGDLILTRVSIWNRGTGLIEKTDLVAADPLRIECVEGVTIHDAWLMEKNNKPANGATVRLENGRVWLGFDYLGKGEGFTVSLFRSTKVEKPSEPGAPLGKEIIIAGTLKGQKFRNYHRDNYVDAFSRKFYFPGIDKWLNRLPTAVAGAFVICVLLPVSLLFLPALAVLGLIDTVRNLSNKRLDSPYLS